MYIKKQLTISHHSPGIWERTTHLRVRAERIELKLQGRLPEWEN